MEKKLYKAIILFLLILIVPGIVFCQTTDNSEVDIQIKHGIEINKSIPGYRIIVTNWGRNEVLSLDLVDSEGNQINLVSSKQNVKADKNGNISIDIPYTYKEIKPGMCILFVSGKPGVHLIEIEYPRLDPPTEEKPYWDVWFSKSEPAGE